MQPTLVYHCGFTEPGFDDVVPNVVGVVDGTTVTIGIFVMPGINVSPKIV